MDTTVAALVVALLVVVALTALLWRSQNRNAPAKASVQFGEWFTANVELGPQNEARAEEAVREAQLIRGSSADPSPEVWRGQQPTRLARVLWVDDHPDNNVYETLALENLGRFITHATSTEAALLYLDRLEFTLAITDVERAGDVAAGEDFIRRARAAGHRLPIVVYTSNAANWRPRLLAADAQAVVDLPGDLIREVDRLIPRSPTPAPAV